VLRCGLILTATEQNPEVGSCEQGNELLDFIKGEKFLDELCDYYFRKNNSASLALVVRAAYDVCFLQIHSFKHPGEAVCNITAGPYSTASCVCFPCLFNDAFQCALYKAPNDI
jgi:hypothetical protein